MMNYNTVQEIYSRNYGSERLYKRPFCKSLVYTDGVMDFQQCLNAFWMVDLIISHMSSVVETYKNTDDSFYLVEICLNQKQEGYMEIYHEGYIGNDYHEHITIAKQSIPFIDLPLKTDEEITTYEFYLSLYNYNPIQFMLLLPSEY